MCEDCGYFKNPSTIITESEKEYKIEGGMNDREGGTKRERERDVVDRKGKRERGTEKKTSERATYPARAVDADFVDLHTHTHTHLYNHTCSQLPSATPLCSTASRPVPCSACSVPNNKA